MGPAQRTVGAPGKWATSLGGRGGFLKKVMPELNLEKNDRIHQVYERNRWAFQVGGRACAKARKYNVSQKAIKFTWPRGWRSMGRRRGEISKSLRSREKELGLSLEGNRDLGKASESRSDLLMLILAFPERPL